MFENTVLEISHPPGFNINNFQDEKNNNLPKFFKSSSKFKKKKNTN